MKKILVPTDFSKNAEKAFLYAVSLATAYDAQITLFHVISLFQEDPNNPAYHFPDIDSVLEAVEKEADANFDSLRSGQKGLWIETRLARAISPAEEIVQFASNEKFDLIVMGTHGRSGLSHFLVGSVAERVLRHSPCPVITIRQESAPIDPLKPIKRILAPVDFSNYAKLALGNANKLARRFGASVELLYVIEEQLHPAYYVTGETSIFKIQPELREKSREALEAFVNGGLDPEVISSVHIREGRVHEEIVSFASEQNVDLIVMATHGLSGLDHFLIGSTTEKVVRRSAVPVLTSKAAVREKAVPA